MNYFKLIVVIIFILFYITGCKKDSTQGLSTRIFPQDSILTFTSSEEQTVELCFELFSSDEDNKFIKENIEDLYIKGDDGASFSATVVKTVQHSKVVLDEINLYRTTFTVSINRKECTNLNNAIVNIRLKDEDTYFSYELGNLAFIENDDDERIRQPLEITELSEITTEKNGMSYTVGVICQLDVAAGVTIKGFDMSLADYGADKIYIVEKEYESVATYKDNHKLDELVGGIYDIDTVTKVESATEPVILEKGIYTVVIKFNMTSNARALSNVGGNLLYDYKSESYLGHYNSNKKVTPLNYSSELLREVLYKDE